MTRHRDRKGSLVIKGRDRKCWVSQWPQGKKRPSEALGWCDEVTKSQAERAHRQLTEKVNRQRDTVGDPVALRGFFHAHYWDEETQEYRDELNTKKPSTRSDMKNTMLHILIPRWGRRKMDSIKTSEIQSFLASSIGEGRGSVSKKTALKWRNYLSSMFTAAMRLEVGVTHNPARGVKVPAAAGREQAPAYITVQQAVEILDQLQDSRHRMACQLAVWLGNRCGELQGLRWGSVNWEQNSITITESVWQGHSTLPKSQNGYRKVILTPNQIDVLRRYKEENYPNAGPNDWVLPGKRNRPIHMGRVMTHHVRPAAKMLGIEEVHWHALRHPNNDENVDIATRKDRFGHTSDRVNLIYSHAGDQATGGSIGSHRKEAQGRSGGSSEALNCASNCASRNGCSSKSFRINCGGVAQPDRASDF